MEKAEWETKWSSWIPNKYEPEFHFRTGTIYDKKAIGITGWDAIPDGTIIKKFKQQIKFVYRDVCQKKDTKNKELVSKIYVVTVEKKDGKIKWTHVIEPN